MGSEYAGFWQRVAAWLIDALIVAAASGVVAVALTWPGGILVHWLYGALFESSARQATPGKMALGIVVTDLHGRRLTFPRATGRHFAKYLSGFLLGIGYLMAAFTERKQGLHDLLAGTLVMQSPVEGPGREG